MGISGIAEGVYKIARCPVPAADAVHLFGGAAADRLRRRNWTYSPRLAAPRSHPSTLNGRSACHYCGPCERGCVTRSYFNSAFTTMADALATGNCTHIPDAMVYKVVMDPDAPRARGVLYIDRVRPAAAGILRPRGVLCAQALESVRVLFNSATPRFQMALRTPAGSRRPCRTMSGTAGAQRRFHMPARPSLGAPRRPNGIYVVRFRNTKTGPKSKAFLRGYGFQGGWGGPDFNWSAPGFGEAFKAALLSSVTTLNLGGFGECLSQRRENSVGLDRDVVDVFGIPVLRIRMSWSANGPR